MGKKDKDIEESIYNMLDLVEAEVISVRDDMSKIYDVTDGFYKNFHGLCNTATIRLIDNLRISLKNTPVDIYSIHGEQKHTPRTESCHWPFQHTWLAVDFDQCTIYADPTCGQFKDLYNDIPDYYVSTKPPKWFYPDSRNPVWNGITARINEKIKIKRKGVPPYSADKIIEDGIIEFLQYEVWGRISDIIRKIMGKGR